MAIFVSGEKVCIKKGWLLVVLIQFPRVSQNVGNFACVDSSFLICCDNLMRSCCSRPQIRGLELSRNWRV